MTTRTVLVDMRKAVPVSRRLCQVLDGELRTVGEVALLMAYCQIAEGARDFPAATRTRRAELVVKRAGFAICEVIEQVAAMTDEDVHVEALAAGAAAEVESRSN